MCNTRAVPNTSFPGKAWESFIFQLLCRFIPWKQQNNLLPELNSCIYLFPVKFEMNSHALKLKLDGPLNHQTSKILVNQWVCQKLNLICDMCVKIKKNNNTLSSNVHFLHWSIDIPFWMEFTSDPLQKRKETLSAGILRAATESKMMPGRWIEKLGIKD